MLGGQYLGAVVEREGTSGEVAIESKWIAHNYKEIKEALEEALWRKIYDVLKLIENLNVILENVDFNEIKDIVSELSFILETALPPKNSFLDQDPALDVPAISDEELGTNESTLDVIRKKAIIAAISLQFIDLQLKRQEELNNILSDLFKKLETLQTPGSLKTSTRKAVQQLKLLLIRAKAQVRQTFVGFSQKPEDPSSSRNYQIAIINNLMLELVTSKLNIHVDHSGMEDDRRANVGLYPTEIQRFDPSYEHSQYAAKEITILEECMKIMDIKLDVGTLMHSAFVGWVGIHLLDYLKEKGWDCPKGLNRQVLFLVILFHDIGKESIIRLVTATKRYGPELKEQARNWDRGKLLAKIHAIREKIRLAKEDYDVFGDQLARFAGDSREVEGHYQQQLEAELDRLLAMKEWLRVENHPLSGFINFSFVLNLLSEGEMSANLAVMAQMVLQHHQIYPSSKIIQLFEDFQYPREAGMAEKAKIDDLRGRVMGIITLADLAESMLFNPFRFYRTERRMNFKILQQEARSKNSPYLNELLQYIKLTPEDLDHFCRLYDEIFGKLLEELFGLSLEKFEQMSLDDRLAFARQTVDFREFMPQLYQKLWELLNSGARPINDANP